MKTETTSLLHFVQVKKLIHRSDSADFPDVKEHPIGVDYTIEGYCRGLPTEESSMNRPLVIARTKRNGVDKAGIFMTTPIVELLHNVGLKKFNIQTFNSIYELDYSIGPNGGAGIELSEIECPTIRALVQSVFFA